MKRILALCATMATALSAQTFTSLYSFADQVGGWFPLAGLVQATNGELYGTVSSGGASDAGLVFEITPTGTLTVLHSFCAQSGCTDGSDPSGALIQAADGNLYGTASGSGAFGGGTVFVMTPSGTLTTLYSFCALSDCADGQSPQAGLLQAIDGNFYGTTAGGGANNSGTVFEITPAGTLTTLYSFCALSDCTDGSAPQAVLIQAFKGNFYGTTSGGGANGQGTIFSITPGGTLTTLYTFGSQSDDGTSPNGLVEALNGDFYGTTAGGGANASGTVFKFTPSGVLTTLYSFCALTKCHDGEQPEAGLIQATNRNFYGTTSRGGTSHTISASYGTVFEITPGGTLRTIHNFEQSDGTLPYAPLVQDTNGALYGTTKQGGAHSVGTIFSLTVGLPAFVETQTTTGTIGATVNILGSDLTGATSVTFNGTSAAFTVVSEYLITATVPTGATSGTVQVVTPGGTLSSNLPFTVL